MSPAQQTIQYHDITLTDIQLHVQEPCNPPSLYRATVKSIRNKRAGRVYTTQMSGNPLKVVFDSPDMEEQIAAGQRAGKQIRFVIPKEGLRIVAGKDLVEFMKSHKKKLWQ
jgi:hypothetical protein